ncbi:sensor histidine kinase [Alicycliphilus sp. T452]
MATHPPAEPRRGAGLAARLLLIGLLAALAITTAGGWVLRHRLEAVVLRSAEQGLAERAERVAAQLRDGAGTGSGEFHAIFSGWYWQLEGAAQPVRRSRSLWDSGLDTSAARPVPGSRALLRLAGPRGEPLLGLRRSVDGGAVLHVFGPAAETDAEVERIGQVLLSMQGVFIALLMLLTVLQVRIGLRPLRRLGAQLQRVRGGDATQIGAGYGPDLDPLAAQIDEVLERNARIVERSRHHAADLSHALKKPLALLAGAAAPQAHAQALRGQVLAQVAAMSGLIDRHLARAGSGAGDMRWIAVAPRLSAIVALMRTLHGARALDWELDAPAGLRWNGEPTDLEEMAGNLLDNAGKWARARVRCTARALAGGGIEIRVEDDGAGLPAHQRAEAEAARRGRRFDEEVDGSGLGLAIVRDIAATYGGALTLGQGSLGGLGCTLVLR